MEKINIWILLKQPFYQRLRYLVIEVDSSYYLIDTDHYTFWLGYICPIFNWIIPHKVMKIALPTKKLRRMLLDRESEMKYKKSRLRDSWIGVIIAILAPTLLNFLGDMLSVVLPISFKHIFVIVVVTFMLLMKIYAVKSSKEVLTKIGKEKLFKSRVLLFPASVTQGLKVLCMFFFILSFWSFPLLVVLNESNWFISLMGVGVFLLFLFINPLLMQAQLSRYKVKFLD